ncbi:zinc ribbon domain-containing protein [Hespellia stercorisuis]|uniref:MORN repeat-containing protein n=1 Tax=Hespellia stercorisuis DSM 15480 TaxID=1121950 RepID=A0A1M6LVF6_9FIRM|nr:zinc ribbon domain-containing protein [Hespellia stercorisuis]SHJ75160.1 MORN repeat-containing protein [Hespellia stercorisuis DSM 15480]
MFCKYCGKEVKEGWVKCPYCGKNIVQDSDKSNIDENDINELVNDKVMSFKHDISEEKNAKIEKISDAIIPVQPEYEIPIVSNGNRWKKIIMIPIYIIIGLLLLIGPFTATGAGTTKDVVIEVVQYYIAIGILFILPIMLITNFKGIRDRLPLYKNHKIGTTLLATIITYVCISIGLSLGFLVTDAMHTQTYSNEIKAQNAQKEQELADKEAEKQKAEEQEKVEKEKAAEEKAAKEKAAKEKAAEEKAAKEKAAEEKKAAEVKAVEEKRAAEAKAVEEKRAAEAKAAEEKKAAEAKAAEEKKVAEEKKKAEEEAARKETLATLPYLSLEYQKAYLEDNNIPVKTFSEISMIQDYCDAHKEDMIYLEEKDGFLSSKKYYEKSFEETDLVYIGQTKDDKPDGMGIITKMVDAQINNGELIISEYDGFFSKEENSYLLLKYIGKFSEGHYEGTGMSFATPVDEEFTSQDIHWEAFFQNQNNDMASSLLNSLNPCIYEGEFENGEYSGKGNQYGYGFLSVYLVDASTIRDFSVYTGEFKKGEKNGRGKYYENGWLRYDGDYKNSKYSGKGKSYYRSTNQVKYSGEWMNGEYNGEGTLYNENGGIEYSGEWKDGENGVVDALGN